MAQLGTYYFNGTSFATATSVFTDAALTTLASRGTTDFRLLTEPMENLQLNFWIKNLLNDHHRMSSIPFGPAFGQLTLSYFNAPRTIGMDLHYNF